MNEISDDLLKEIYQKAVEFNLDSDFIKLLTDELVKRNLWDNSFYP
ncbi:sporulation histidine kinase inhibitor Sda [Salipaludibacillus sp. CUR1]|nr:sporulation histidine kinase inhibitor Sda [Salipaludibacillus sp. CUR1]MCE7792985.1 sporulation histidine kinase inhibitor Sda [Salipaludibacillus sp. CUR1]